MRKKTLRACGLLFALVLTPGISFAASKPPHPKHSKVRPDQVATLSDAAAQSRRYVGTAASHGLVFNDELYTGILTDEFNYITPENAGKWGPLQPVSPDEWNFAAHDELVAFAYDNRMAFKGHALVWHQQAPSFVNDDLTADELQVMIDAHITTTVSRYRWQIRAWDVVNEAVGDDAQLRGSVFYRVLGEDYIANAFRTAKAADPRAKLYYNDYNIAGINPKSDAVYQLLKGLKEADVPVDGIGFQMHLTAASAPSYEELVANLRRFAQLGLRVNISELDVRISDLPWNEATSLAIQQQVYHRVVSACMAVRRCESVTTWGISDQYSWINYTFGEDAPLAWDADYNRKPAYYGMLDGFMGIRPDSSDLPNLVANAHFESGADGWSAWAATLDRARSKKARRYLGNSLLVTDRTENWSAAAYDLTSSVVAGQAYDVSAKVKLGWKSEDDTVELNTKVVCADGDTRYNNLEVSVAGGRRWTRLDGSTTLPDCDLLEVLVYVSGPQAGVDMIVDRVVVRPQVLVPNAEGYGPNLVANAYFEDGADYWFGFGDAQVGTTTENVKSGSQSAYVTGRTASWQGPATSVLDGVLAGDIYNMFAWVNLEDASGWVGATVKASCTDGDQYLGITGASVEAGSWSLMTGTVQLPDCELSDLTLYFEGADEGVNMLVDEVYFRRDNAASDALDVVDDGNLLSNGGFELGTDGWTSWGGVLSTSTDLVHSGSASGVLGERTANWQGPVFNLLSVASAGREYGVSAWGMVQGSASENLNITVKTVCADTGESYNQLASVAVSDTGWTELAGAITLPDCDLTEASLYFDGPDAGVDTYLDDVRVVSLSEPNPNLVTNGGFEDGTDGWQSWGGSLQAVADEAHSGSQSALLSSRTGSWEGPVYPLSGIVSGQSYQVSAWIKIAGAAADAANITMKTVCDDGTEFYNWGGQVDVNSSSWVELAGVVDVPADCETVEAYVYFGGPAQEVDIYIDDVSVVAL